MTFKRLRISKGFSQTRLAELLGVTNWTVSKWECGNQYPKDKEVFLLSKVLGVSPEIICKCLSDVDEEQVKVQPKIKPVVFYDYYGKDRSLINLLHKIKSIMLPLNLSNEFCRLCDDVYACDNYSTAIARISRDVELIETRAKGRRKGVSR